MQDSSILLYDYPVLAFINKIFNKNAWTMQCIKMIHTTPEMACFGTLLRNNLFYVKAMMNLLSYQMYLPQALLWESLHLTSYSLYFICICIWYVWPSFRLCHCIVNTHLVSCLLSRQPLVFNPFCEVANFQCSMTTWPWSCSFVCWKRQQNPCRNRYKMLSGGCHLCSIWWLYPCQCATIWRRQLLWQWIWIHLYRNWSLGR